MQMEERRKTEFHSHITRDSIRKKKKAIWSVYSFEIAHISASIQAHYLSCEKLPSEITEINQDVKHLLKTRLEDRRERSAEMNHAKLSPCASACEMHRVCLGAKVQVQARRVEPSFPSGTPVCAWENAPLSAVLAKRADATLKCGALDPSMTLVPSSGIWVMLEIKHSPKSFIPQLPRSRLQCPDSVTLLAPSNPFMTG